MPRCALYRPRGHAQDFGIGGQAIPLVRTTRWHNSVHEDLPYVSNDEIRQQGKGRVTTAAGNFLKEMAHVTTDLITDLLESNGFTAILVFVDKLTKMVHLTGCKKEVIAMEYAQIFIDNVFQLHGLPEVIISDWDPRFTDKLWRAMFDLLRTDP